MTLLTNRWLFRLFVSSIMLDHLHQLGQLRWFFASGCLAVIVNATASRWLFGNGVSERQAGRDQTVVERLRE
ncbi:MAG: hypothetical protein CBB71_12590 [Rhodopirellula sp. TMED11]|nr:MAG: hypothetical protein CBB71_12590 [Rhodopirellula sp. TMED11]